MDNGCIILRRHSHNWTRHMCDAQVPCSLTVRIAMSRHSIVIDTRFMTSVSFYGWQRVFILFMLHFNNIVNLRKRCFTSVNIAANVFVNCIMAIVIWPTPHKCKWHCNGTTVLKTLICVTCVPLCAFVPIDIKLIVQSATPLSRGCVCIVLLFRGASEPVLMKQNRTKTDSVKC